ncbi:T9SS type A sorting domain-containing protein, partial [Bacteroides heparinolyticus]
SYDRATSVVKFPAEAFVGIEEAHDNGLKVAVAYPNPGKDVLNIRTGLRDAWVEVYDSNGRLIHSQALTENVTGIDAGDWAEGIYVWKVMAEGKEAECGKWVKE